MSRIYLFLLLLAGLTMIASSQPSVTPFAKAGAGAAPLAGKAAPVRSRSLVTTLLTPVDFPGETDREKTLVEVLDTLTKRHAFAYRINQRAFRAEQVPEVAKFLVVDSPIPAMKAPLGKVIARILERVTNPSGATFLTRLDEIEITTGQFVANEINLERSESDAPPNPPNDPLNEKRFSIPLVNVEVDRRPLEEAIRQIRTQANASVVLDPALGHKIETPVSITLLNAPLDTALRVLTEMGDLDFAWLDNVFYVTTSDRAKKLRSTWPSRRGGGGALQNSAAAGGAM